MAKWLKLRGLAVLIACSYALPCAAQCGFAIVPAAEAHWYRNDGWPIPGLDDAKAFMSVHLTINGEPKDWASPEGITFSWVVHEDGYSVQFPDAVFDDNGARKRMLPRSFKLDQMLRWEMNSTPYAYSYLLSPYDVACTASVDIIDDRGDGRFRLMTSPGHTIWGRNLSPPAVPEWLKKPKS